MSTARNQNLTVHSVESRVVEIQSDIATWQSTLQSAALNALDPESIAGIVSKQVEKAKKGDTKAASFVMGMIGQKRSVNVNVKCDVETGARMERGK